MSRASKHSGSRSKHRGSRMFGGSRASRLEAGSCRWALCAAVLFAAGCGKAPTPVTSDALQVVAHLPQADTPLRSSVDVIFDRPMVALGEEDPAPAEGRRILEIEPQPAGTYHWIGTRTLSFIVPEGLPAATHYRARVPAGTQAPDGTRLPRDVAWEFTTPRPQLLASVPAAGDSLARPQDPLVLLFSIAVQPEAVAQSALLDGISRWRASRPDSALLLQLGPRFWSAEPERLVRLDPAAPLERDRAYLLSLQTTLRGSQGPLGPAEEIHVPFRTYGPSGLRLALPGHGATISLRFRTPVDPDSVRAYAELSPLPPGSRQAPSRITAWGYRNEVWLGGDLGFAQRYALRLRRGLPDLFGQRLEEPQDRELKTGDRFPMLELRPSDATLLPSTPRTVALSYSGVGTVELRAARVGSGEEIRAQGQPQQAARNWALRRVFPAPADANRIEIHMVDLSGVLPASGRGAVLVEATTLAREPGAAPRRWEARSVLRWTDVGVSVKVSPENGLAWVTRLGTGQPLPGAALHIRDAAGKVMWRGNADARGLAPLPGYRELGSNPWEMGLVVAVGSDTCVTGLDGDWRLAPWRFRIPGDYDLDPVPARAFLYADRDLYRPGETLHVAGIVRRLDSGGLRPADVDSLRLVVRDPMYREFALARVAVDRFGGFAADLPTAAASPVGRYRIEARVAAGTGKPRPAAAAGSDLPAGRPDQPPPRPAPPTDWAIGGLSVELAAYRAPAFRAGVRAEPRHVLPGGEIVADVSGAYYFGAPLGGAPLQWSLVRQHADFRPRGFEAFSFGDPEIETTQAGQIAAGAGALGDSGTVRLRLPLPPETIAVAQILTVEATLRDPTGDAVSGRAGVLYHPASVYAGVALERGFVEAGDTLVSRCIAVRADTALAAPGTPLEVALVRREWRSIRKLLVGGRVGFETTQVDSVIETRHVAAEAQPVTVSWTMKDPGGYVLRATATDEAGRKQTSTAFFWVAGPRLAGARPDDSPQIELETDRKLYRPGDVARVLVTSPLQGRRAVVSVEREGVIEWRLVELSGGSQVFEVPVRDAFAPNVYVGVAVVEPALTESQAPSLPPSARQPRYRAGYARLDVDVSARKLAVDVEPQRPEYAPGDSARVVLRVRDAGGRGVPAHLGVAVVDEAVLALLGTPVPDPFEFFYRDRPLAVRNADTRLRLSAGARAEAQDLKASAGGDGGEALAARSQFATTAYWNPDVVTNADGTAHVTFALPDNLTRFRVAVVAASRAEDFGSGSGGFRVGKPLTLQPALPRFALVGDTLQVAVLITNRTPQRLAGRVQIEAGLRLLDKAETGIEIEPNASRRVAFRAVAAQAGDQTVRWSARFPGASDAVAVTLPVVEPRVERTAATAGFTAQVATENVALPAAALPGTGDLTVELAASAIAAARPAFEYVLDYRYGCLEQLSSRLLVLVLAKELGLQVTARPDELDERIASLVRRIESMSLPEGGFAFWPGGQAAEPWLTAYATYTLSRAQRAGAKVSADVVQSAGWSLARGWRERESRGGAAGGGLPHLPLGIGLFAVSELARLESGSIVEPADIDFAADHADSLPADEQLFLALALHNWQQRPELVRAIQERTLNRANLTAAGAVIPAPEGAWVSAPFRTATRSTSLALLLSSRLGPGNALVPRLAHGLLGLRERGHWGTTQDDALGLLALSEFRRLVEQPAGRMSAAVRLAGSETPLLALESPAGSLERRVRSLPLPGGGAAGTTLRFAQEGGGLLHYSAELRWEENGLEQKPLDAGYGIVRRIEPLIVDGEVPGAGRRPSAQLGDLLVVTLQIVVPRESYYLAIRDPLPAGLEVVQPHFRVESRQASGALERWRSLYEPLPVSHVERLDREVRLFADGLAPGVYEHRYVARVRAAGGFGQLPATIEAMYAPELHGASGATRWQANEPAERGSR